MIKKTVFDYEVQSVRKPARYGLSVDCLIHPSVWVARAVYVLRHGHIADSSTYVCHRCDRAGCIEDTHHFLGSHLDNIKDAQQKGRMHSQSFREGLRTLRKGKPHSPLTKAKIAEAMRGNQNATKEP